MTTELSMLLWSVVLGLVQIALAASGSVSQRGLAWAAGPRDGEPRVLTGIPARLCRASNNFLETFPLFAVAVLLAFVLQRHDGMTALGAQLYFWGRLVYLPVYAAGTPYLRTLVWTVSIVGIVLILAALF
ncbi:MAPEG family protein [Rhodanobacter ginsengiterrae]|uniref:MAPEG family protein n=1 Tax=Rhodanobacter ginsengiterrae TaxID=2008451 RepID=UPI003CE7C617